MDPYTIAILGSLAANLFGAHQAASASDRAAQLQYASTQDALGFAKQAYAQSQLNQAPWLSAGRGAVTKLSYLLGVPMDEIPQAPAAATSSLAGLGDGATQGRGTAGSASGNGQAGNLTRVGAPAGVVYIGGQPYYIPGQTTRPVTGPEDPNPYHHPAPGNVGRPPDPGWNGFFSGNPGGATFGADVPSSGGSQEGGSGLHHPRAFGRSSDVIPIPAPDSDIPLDTTPYTITLGDVGAGTGYTPAGGGGADTVLMRAPNGQTKRVPTSAVAHYQQRGAEVVS